MTSAIRNLPSIVEQGTSGIWTYRKWSDGTVECWGTTPNASHAMTSASGSCYWVSENYNFPSDLFISSPNVQANRNGGNGLVFISVYGATTTRVACYVCCAAKATETFQINFYAIGKWK